MYILNINVENELDDYPNDWVIHDVKNKPFLSKSSIKVRLRINGYIDGNKIENIEPTVNITRLTKSGVYQLSDIGEHKLNISNGNVIVVPDNYIDDITLSLIENECIAWCIKACEHKIKTGCIHV